VMATLMPGDWTCFRRSWLESANLTANRALAPQVVTIGCGRRSTAPGVVRLPRHHRRGPSSVCPFATVGRQSGGRLEARLWAARSEVACSMSSAIHPGQLADASRSCCRSKG
jgi:hypothetical protein